MDSKFILDNSEDDVAFEERAVLPKQQIVTTPFVEGCCRMFENCRTTRSIGIIQGPSGTGKTIALDVIRSRVAAAASPSIVHVMQCCRATGPSSGVRAIMLDLGIGGAVTSNRSVAGLAYLLKLAQREIASTNIVAICLDDADQYSIETLEGVVRLFDQLRDVAPVVFLMTGVAPESQWIGQIPAAATRTLHIERSEPLTQKMTGAVLKKMSAKLDGLVGADLNGNELSKGSVKAIHTHTGGLLRRLRFFSDLANADARQVLDRKAVDELLAQMEA